MSRRAISADNGVALVIALMAVLLLTALGLMLVLNTATELMVAGRFRAAQEAFYAADAAVERVMADLADSADWNPVLTGVERSAFVDGGAAGARTLSDGSAIDLTKATNLLNCGHAAQCTAPEMDAINTDRPWGVNNPRWLLFAYGWLGAMGPANTGNSPMYVAVWVGDDPSDNDNDPSTDANGAIVIHAEAFGPGGAHKILEATVCRLDALQPLDGIRLLAWLELR